MATIEANGLLLVKDADGNLYIVKPVTSKENIEDLNDATQTESGLMSIIDKKKLDGITMRIAEDEQGFYIVKE